MRISLHFIRCKFLNSKKKLYELQTTNFRKQREKFEEFKFYKIHISFVSLFLNYIISIIRPLSSISICCNVIIIQKLHLIFWVEFTLIEIFNAFPLEILFRLIWSSSFSETLSKNYWYPLILYVHSIYSYWLLDIWKLQQKTIRKSLSLPSVSRMR